MQKIIPWSTGGGNITLIYNDSKDNQTITITSDENTGEARSKTINIIAGNITKSLKISQAEHIKQSGSITAVPSSYNSTYSSYKSVNSSYPISRAYTNTSSSTYAQITCNTGSKASTYISFAFDLSSIPDNATIKSVTCKFKARVGSTSYIATAVGQLYNNNTAMGSSTSWRSISATVCNITSTGSWNRSELNNLLLRLTATRGTSNTNKSTIIYIYGAELTIQYEY